VDAGSVARHDDWKANIAESGDEMKYDFASKEWLAAIHGFVHERARAAALTDPDVTMSFCQVIQNVPAHIAPSGEVAFHFFVKKGVVTFAHTDSDACDLKITGDWAAIREATKIEINNDPEQMKRLMALSAEATKKGLIKMEGTPERPASMGFLHDVMAQLTA